MDSDQVLKEVRKFVDKAHGDQMRKYTPERYIVHPVRVMEIMKTVSSDITVLAAALLHDVLEDTLTTKEEIRIFLSSLMDESTVERTIHLVVELTDVYIKKDYPQWNRKKRKALEAERVRQTSADAQTIKYADIIDNCREIVKHDRHFAVVFLAECKKILHVIDKGDPELYQKAKELINQKLVELKRQ
jgi:guanosine-3',5'-bis(diphosphate) 3'-pyrophosphohydrolase